MILYHGSNMSIDTIDLKRGRRGKDFGQGLNYIHKVQSICTICYKQKKISPVATTALWHEIRCQCGCIIAANKIPKKSKNTYPDASYIVITPDNIEDFIG